MCLPVSRWQQNCPKKKRKINYYMPAAFFIYSYISYIFQDSMMIMESFGQCRTCVCLCTLPMAAQ